MSNSLFCLLPWNCALGLIIPTSATLSPGWTLCAKELSKYADNLSGCAPGGKSSGNSCISIF